MAPDPPLLRIDGLRAGYGSGLVLHGTTLDVRLGEVTVIVGPNGVGKTTLVETIMGLLPASGGRVLFDGVDLLPLPPTARRGLGLAYVPQGRRVFRSLTVDEHLSLVKTSPTARFDRDWIFATFPRLAERQNAPARTLSGGEQSMLAIARALTAEPRLVVMDEPTEGLAPHLVGTVRRVIDDLRALGLTILLVEQNPRFALAVADRIAVMHRGVIDFVRPRAAIADVEALGTLVLGASDSAATESR